MEAFGDLIFAMAHWLRTTTLSEFSLWLSNQPVSQVIDRNFWAIPTIQTIHILAIATMFGSVGMITLRIFQLAGRGRTVVQTVERYLPWMWRALLTLLVTGLLMVIGEPVRELINPVFWMKMILVVAAALVGLWFQSSVRRDPARWELTPERQVSVRAGAVGVIVLLCVIMFAGRWIAYAPV